MKVFILPLLFYVMLMGHGCAQSPTHSATHNPPTDSIQPPAMVSDSVMENLKREKAVLVKKMESAQVTYFIIKAPDNMFGYSIFIDGQMYVEQKSIPALEGIKGFDSKEDAEKIAKMVVRKIKEGEMPPTVTPEELREQGVIR